MRHAPMPYPISWPETAKRAKRRVFSHTFKRTETDAVREIKRQLELLRAGNILISTDKLRFSDAANPESGKDPGVAVYFTYKSQERAVAVDLYSSTRANLCAAANTIEALRTIERHGGLDIFEQALQGFNVQALPPPSAQPTHKPKRPWNEVLGVAPGTSIEVAEAVYRTLSKSRHPDANDGSTEKFQELQEAISAAREALK